VDGQLRHWEKDHGKPLPIASQRTVRDCLKILAGLVVEPGKRVRLPVVEQPGLKPTVAAGQVTALYRELVDLAGSGPLEREGLGIKAQERSRLLALVSVVLDTGARVGELERMNVDDLAEDLSEVTVTRRPQNPGVGYEEVAYRLGVSRSSVARVAGGGTDPHVSEALRQEVLREVEAIRAEGPRVERYALREGTRVALRRWLAVREDLVAEVEGGRSGLWVTVFPSKAGPPGVRIRAQGLGQSYARGVTAINFVMAGQPGWEPLPVRMEQLRRSVDVEPLEDEAGQ
jgi:integrase